MSYEPVIGIDFGATYTKIACRKRLEIPFGEPSDRRSQSVEFTASLDDYPAEGLAAQLAFDDSVTSFLIPSCIFRNKDGKLSFGMGAWGMIPGTHDRLYINWKSELFREDGRQPEDDIRELAKAFFKWLRVKLGRMENTLEFAVDEATIRICVPAFEQAEPYVALLGEILVEAGWKNETIVKSSEPIANTVGYATQGRNATTLRGRDYGTMFHCESSFMRFVRKAPLNGAQSTAHLVVVDIGSFTSDLSVVEWGPNIRGFMKNNKQVSYRHGIVGQLDDICLPDAFRSAGIDYKSLSFLAREGAKEKLYHGGNFDLDGLAIGGGAINTLIDAAMRDFSEKLIMLISESLSQTRPKWFLLTGGGSNIPKVKEALVDFFDRLGDGPNLPRIPTIIRDYGVQVGGELRNETSIGACSIYWDSVTDLETETETERGRGRGRGRGREWINPG